MAVVSPVRVVYADDDPLFRTQLAHTFLEHPGVDLVAVTVDGFSACRAIREHRPDVAVVSVGLAGIGGFEIAETVCGQPGPPPRVLVLGAIGAEIPREPPRSVGVRAVLDRATPRDRLAHLVATLGAPLSLAS